LCAALAASCAAGSLAAASPAQAAIPYTAYVANWGAGTVTPINTATNAVGAPIAVGASPAGVAITPDDKTAYVANYGSNTVTPITLATNSAGTPIAVGAAPVGIAITPDGTTAYVANSGSNTVTPITLATNSAGTPIAVGPSPRGIAVTPDGKTAYVANSGANTVTPITLATNSAETPIAVGSAPVAVAIAPGGASAYVADSGFNTVTPITLAINTPRAPITSGNGPWGIAITPDGATAYVANLGDVDFTGNTTSGSTTVSGIASTARLAQGMAVTGVGIPAGTTIAAPPVANSVTLSQAATSTASGVALTAWEPSSVMPVDLATQTAGTAISVASWVVAEPAITPDQAPVASFTVSSAAAGTASSFDASASTVAYGTITSYTWNFGDGSGAVTSTPTATHTYAAAGEYAVTLTETDSAGTSTTQVFTGQTMSRNGGPSARITRSVFVSAAASSNTGVANSSAAASSSAPAALGSAWAPVVISVRSLAMTAGGDIVIPLSCPAAALGGCRGRITIQLAEPSARRANAFAARCTRGCRALGGTNYEARAGGRIKVRVHIASFGRRLLLRRGKLRVRLTATSIAGTKTATTSLAVSLRARSRAA
jgi:YVTN family beta-propeller protein